MRELWVQNLIDVGVCGASVAAVCLLLFRVEQFTSRIISRRLGWNGVLLTAWLGVPVHELSHLVMAKMFGHRIIRYSLFDPDPSTGTLGYVWHAHRKSTFYQYMGNFFIGISPPVAGLAAIAAWLQWLGPPGGLHTVLFSPAPAWAELQWAWSWHTLIEGYVLVCIVSHMAPSHRDLRGAVGAGVATLLFVLAGSAAAGYGGVAMAPALRAIGPVVTLASVAVVLQLLYAAVVWGVTTLRDAPRGLSLRS